MPVTISPNTVAFSAPAPKSANRFPAIAWMRSHPCVLVGNHIIGGSLVPTSKRNRWYEPLSPLPS